MPPQPAEIRPESLSIGGGCRSPVAARPLLSTARTGRALPGTQACAREVANDGCHGLVDQAVRCQDISAAGRKRLARRVRDAAPGFSDDERAAGDVPRLEVAFPESVDAAGGDV